MTRIAIAAGSPDAALNTPAALRAADVIRGARHRPDRRTDPEVLSAWETLLAARDATLAALASRPTPYRVHGSRPQPGCRAGGHRPMGGADG